MAEATETPDKVTYRGNCHCRTFVFEATMPPIKEIMVCDCSICYKKAYAFAMVDEDSFKVVKGDVDKDLTTYKFGPGTMSHMFCSKCGIAVINSYSTMPGHVAINVRAVQGPINVWDMPKKKYDGKTYKPDYVPPNFDSLPDPPFEVGGGGGGKVYKGSCHCGDVTVALKVPKPLEEDRETRMVEDNCSICQRTGATWIYPHRDQVVVKTASGGVSGSEDDDSSLVAYSIRLGSHLFCRRCGVFVANRLNAETDEEFARLPEAERELLADKRHWRPLNLRIFPELDVGALNVVRGDGWSTIKPEYVNP